MRPQARGATVIAGEKAGPGFGQAQETQGVAGGRGVKHDVVIPAIDALARQQCGEFIKSRNLGGAGTGELLAHGLAFFFASVGFELREHPLAVGLGGGIGVDVEHVQAGHGGHSHRLVRQRYAQHFIEVGGGVGADQQHALPRIGQGYGRGSRQRGFADAAFAGEKQKTGWVDNEAGEVGLCHPTSMTGCTSARYDPRQPAASFTTTDKPGWALRMTHEPPCAWATSLHK